MNAPGGPAVTVTFAGSGDAFGSGGRYQACIHLRPADRAPVLLDCGATSLSALKAIGLDPGEISTVFISHLHGDHFGGLPFLILDGQFTRRTSPLAVAAGADLLIAEAYYVDKAIPYHLRYADLASHGSELTSRRTVLTHLSADMLARRDEIDCDIAHDGLTIQL